ncbi:MAG: metal-dependent hydrolase [Ignavibacteria bacterium]|nr:metal-dependent hydrolase [Ignavibacteria bacterium]
MKLIYHGHTFLEIETGKQRILIDPFITGNIHCKIKPADIKCDYIILTHAHGDHYGDVLQIAEKNDATVIGIFELVNILSSKGVKKIHPMNIGGGFNFPFGRVKLTIAHHSSSTPEGVYAGDPAGVLLTSEGKTIYHSGDTGLFYDMKLIGEMNRIDYAFLPIGDDFTMGIDDAVKAAEFVNAEYVVPIHYDTFDIIKANPLEFKKKVESIGKKCIVMEFGKTLEC